MPLLTDTVLVVALVVTVLRGYRRGALVQVGSLAGTITGLLIGATLGPDLARRVVSEPGLGLATLTLGIVLVGLLVGQAIGVALGLRLRRGLARGSAAPVDQVAGIALSVLMLVLTVWLISAVLVQGPSPAFAAQVQQSRIVSEISQALPQPPDIVGRVGTYLDRQGFPQAVAGLGGPAAPPVDLPDDADIQAAAEAGAAGAVRIQTAGCDAASLGSGFVSPDGVIVTNAHVVAGADEIVVDSRSGRTSAVAIHVDADLDLAVLRAPEVDATPLEWVDEPAERGVTGATLGYPGGQEALAPKAAAVRARGVTVGRDIYGRGQVEREVLTLSASVERGDSGGAFVTAEGQVAGVVFASSSGDPGTGYALTAGSVRDVVTEAAASDTPADTGPCRF